MRTVYDVREHEPIELPLEDLLVRGKVDLYEEVIGSGYLKGHLSGDRITFTAGSHIGLIPLNDRVAINVAPRVPVTQLTRILALSRHVPVMAPRLPRRGYAEDTQRLNSLVDMLAEGLIAEVDLIAHRGLHHEYVQREDQTSFPRGRILMAGAASNAARGFHHRVTAAWFERAVDNAPNRLLKYAIWYLAYQYATTQRRAGQRRIITQLNRLYHIFGGVTLDRSRLFLTAQDVLDPTSLPTSRRYYGPAMYLALTIIQNRGVDLAASRGPVHLRSLLLNMEDAFEGYVRAVLQSRLTARGFVVLDGNLAAPAGAEKPLFDDNDAHPARPDLVLHDAAGSPCLVGDVKYKPSGPGRPDLNQVIAYAVSYGAEEALVVHPKGDSGTSGPYPIGKIGGIEVHGYILDLSIDLEREEERFALAVEAWAA